MAATNTLQRLTSSYAKHLPLAEECCKFLTASPDPFHAVANCVKRLESAGFKALKNGAAFTGQLHAGGKYYYTVHQSTLVAFTVGKKYHPGEGGFHMIGGHTDSPNLKVKPRSLKPPKNGCIMLGVECYGGGLWHTWFDRYVQLVYLFMSVERPRHFQLSIASRWIHSLFFCAPLTPIILSAEFVVI